MAQPALSTLAHAIVDVTEAVGVPVSGNPTAALTCGENSSRPVSELVIDLREGSDRVRVLLPCENHVHELSAQLVVHLLESSTSVRAFRLEAMTPAEKRSGEGRLSIEQARALYSGLPVVLPDENELRKRASATWAAIDAGQTSELAD